MTADSFFLIGDSHTLAIAEAADARRIPWRGGPLAAGRVLEEPFWQIEGDRFVFTAAGGKPLRPRFSDLLTFDGPVLSTVGFNSHRFVLNFVRHAHSQGLPPRPDILSQAAFTAAVHDARRVALAFYRTLADHGCTVYFVASPQRICAGCYPLLRAFEDVLIAQVAATGAHFVETRDAVMEGENLRPEYAAPNDLYHGNKMFGALVLDRFDALRRDIAAQPKGRNARCQR